MKCDPERRRLAGFVLWFNAPVQASEQCDPSCRSGLRLAAQMRLAFVLFALGAFSGQPALAASPGLRHGFFIVATNGNDQWSGNRPAINATKTDGPFATLTNALAAARAWKQTAGAGSNSVVAIFVRSGSYFLTEPLVFKPEDSGLVFAAYSTEKPVISGGRLITGWKPATLNGKPAWMTQVPEAKGGKWRFHELWVNGQRATPARYPARGFLKIPEVPDKTADWAHGNTRFRFQPGDLKLWSSITEGEAVVMRGWVESRLPIASLDEANRFISFKKRSVFPLRPGDIYYLEGIIDFLDEPGEWCLDSIAGSLYYLPRPGEEIGKVEAIAPVLSQVIRIEGTLDTREPVEHIRMKGLTFSHTEWYFPEGFAAGAKGRLGITPAPSPEIGGFAQAEVGVPGAVWGEGAQRCSWKACTFTHLGTSALELARGCVDNLISHCDFSDLGTGGIKIGSPTISASKGDQTFNNEISDCHVYDGGKLFHSGYGIWLGMTGNNRVIHNLVHDFYNCGISTGWSWGYWPTPATNNLIAFNHVHHIGAKSDGAGAIMSDLGGIYTLGVQSGTSIANNLVHDITALTSPGFGIYLDEGTSGAFVLSNVVYRTTDSGFNLHYGATNLVLNNIFAFGKNQQLPSPNKESHLSLTFIRNIVYFDSGVLLNGEWPPNQFRVDSNLYFDARPGASVDRIRIGNSTWAQWRAMGYDRYGTIADPLFLDPRRYDFQLMSNSPALLMAIHPIDLSQVGIRK
jgi:hypothetical protein